MFLPYFKKGDDFGSYLDDAKGDIQVAAENHALAMDAAAKQLRDFAAGVKGVEGVTVEADTHMILVNGPEEVLDGLVAKEVLAVVDWLDEEEEEEEGDVEELLEELDGEDGEEV